MNRSRVVVATLGLLLSASAAHAQDKGQTGLTLGYPASIGVVYHVTGRVAVRPEFSMSRMTTSDQPAGTTSNSNWSYGVGISGLIYMNKWDNLRTYVSPRFTYTRSESTLDTNVLGGVRTIANTIEAYGLVGSFGAQY